MILYYPTMAKFNFNTMNSFGVMGRGHSPPPPPGPGTQKKPGPDRLSNGPSKKWAGKMTWNAEKC